MTEILTERLTLRPFRHEDLRAFVAYRSHPDVARYQTWDSAFSISDAERFLGAQRDVRFGDIDEWLQLAIVGRTSGTIYGDCAVRFAADQPSTAEIGVSLAVEHQGHGFATEALSGLIAVLFEEHDLHRVFAVADDRNSAVHRLLDRLGFRYEARLVEADWFKGSWSTIRTYAMLDREYRAGGATH